MTRSETAQEFDVFRCPTREQLADLVVGQLPAEVLDRVESHVEQCTACQTSLETLDNLEDPLVQGLKHVRLADAASIDAALENQLERAERIAEQVWRTQEGDETEAGGAATRPAGDQPIATRRFGQYELLEQIGAGSMGTVWKAQHLRLQRPVAIKFLPKDRVQDCQAVARFDREMAAVGKLDHPHLVRAHDAGEVDGQPFLVMEYVEGLDLSAIVQRLGPLPVPDACEIIRQAALGLQYAHEHGLIHRDIKPSNLMLTRGGQIKILDLGLALLRAQQAPAGELTYEGQVMGTADYVAPEQVSDSHSVDARADIYSLGCTLYKLLSGQAPFTGPRYRGAFERMMGHVRDAAPPIRGLRSDLPPELAAVVERMMAKDRESRYATPLDAAAALEPLAQGADLGRLYDRPVAATQAGNTGQLPGDDSHRATDLVLQSAMTGTAPSVKPDAHAAVSAARRPLAARFLPRLAAAAGRFRSRRLITAVGLGAFALLMFLGVVIYINRTKITVPDGAEVTIGEKGQVTVRLSEHDAKVPLSPAGAVDHALRFRGFDFGDWVKIPSPKYDPRDPITIEAWFLPDEVAPSEYLHHALVVNVNQGEKLTPSPGFSLGYRSYQNNDWRFSAMLWKDGWSASQRDAGTTGRLCHVAGCWDGKKLQIFLNGYPGLATELTVPEGTTTGPHWSIGAYLGQKNVGAFAGIMDEVRISSVARYHGQFQPQERFEPDQHTLALYHFDEGEGTVAHDASANALHGEILGAKWVTSPRQQHAVASAPPRAVAPFDAVTARKHQEAWAKYLAVPIETTNSIGMRFVLIPPGEFDMGSSEEDVVKLIEEAKVGDPDKWYIDRVRAEAPKHRVRITKPFYVGRCEVTQADYETVMDGNPSAFQGDPTHPVEMVTWHDAYAFCRKLQELPQEQAAGVEYRLLTEAEWEYVCRAGTTTKWYWGDDEGALYQRALFAANAVGKTHPVGQMSPNAWGVYDMHGNVWEWCQDWLGEHLDAILRVDDPTRATTKSSVRARRGGSWFSQASFCRASHRFWNEPEIHSNDVGFRVARIVPMPKSGL